ncbi:immunity 50 family protein [Pseudomonas sp. SWRI153]|uniref:Immunity 50 family protein n=1 Tax=Pseudomonas khorasanensis TaxID=2745508 RepID=A0A923F537_9PSED|nr:Imm50 family immunity protein [Pseudomonas khorasanensis]MBV4488933.1 immunity 50 family protein [Pseudomonas khorasanensis]
MNFWNDLDGSSFFNRIFTSQIPIGEVTLFSVNIDNNRPIVILEFDIKEYPEAPPIKWKQSGFNTCRIGLNCSNIEELLIKNIPTKKNLTVSILNEAGSYRIRAINDESVIEFTTKHPLLCGPSAYLNSLE